FSFVNIHLKPLSVYSRMITCDQKATPTQFCNPFINFKIELKNDGDKKRILDDSSPDEGYETPAKKPFSPNALSPDLGCFLDYSSPTKDLLNVAPAFDCDVDDILCLNPVVTSTPLGTCAAGGPLESVNSPVESLEGDVGEAWNIGLPIFESSLCHNVTVKLNASGQSRQVSEEVKGSHTGLVTLSGDESTLDTSYETTLPLQVQVSCSDVYKYIFIFKSYVFPVDVMTELLKLMSHVADQTPASYDKQWQHPSDLTRRNYQQRFQNIQPKMSLHEWQAKNGATHKRFARVPKIFERSQFP
uniref:S100P-binding protein n=1 Tax=Dicentrarchus labrax TaxID=13489 RepID=A0A8C4DFX2_DICLA